MGTGCANWQVMVNVTGRSSGSASVADDLGQAGYVGCTGGAEARTEIIPEGNAEFLACFEQAEKAVAAITADITASATTDLSLRDLTADVVFRPVGVEWNFGVIEHLQQFRLVGVQTLKQTVEYDETGLAFENAIEPRRQGSLALCGWSKLIGLEIAIEAPDQAADVALGFAVLVGEGVELVNEAFSVNLIRSSG